MEKDNGHSWVNLGNQFILLYLLENDFPFASARNFSIAHAFECYFKACITNKHDEDKAISYGHKVFDMFNELKSDSKFLPQIEIHQDTYNSYRIDNKNQELTQERQMEIIRVSHLLFLFKYCADLKYQKFSKKHKLEGQVAWFTFYPDDRFAEIFFQIREYIGYKRTSHEDSLRYTLENDLLDNRDSFYFSRMEFLNICVFGRKNV